MNSIATCAVFHGARHGVWCCSPVQAALVRAGHVVHAAMRIGVGVRAHLLLDYAT